MITQRVDITDDAWVELTLGSVLVIVEGGVSGLFLITFTNTSNQPSIDAPAHRVQTFQAAIDFTQYGLTPGQRVWARSPSGNSFLIVTREVDVFVRFVPSGSDALITSNGFTFNSIEVAA